MSILGEETNYNTVSQSPEGYINYWLLISIILALIK